MIEELKDFKRHRFTNKIPRLTIEKISINQDGDGVQVGFMVYRKWGDKKKGVLSTVCRSRIQ